MLFEVLLRKSKIKGLGIYLLVGSSDNSKTYTVYEKTPRKVFLTVEVGALPSLETFVIAKDSSSLAAKSSFLEDMNPQITKMTNHKKAPL